MPCFLVSFALALAALVRTAPSSLGLKTPVMLVESNSKVEWSVREARTVEDDDDFRARYEGQGFDPGLEVTTMDGQRGSVTRSSLEVAALHSRPDLEVAVRTPTAWSLWAVFCTLFGALVAVAVAFRRSSALSDWQSLHRRLRCIRAAATRLPCSCVPLHPLRLWTALRKAFQSAQGELLPEAVLVHVRGGGKTKTMRCDAESTVGAMREEMGVPLDAVIILVPGGGELEDEMRVGEIVREGPMTVEVRYRGVGGGEAEDRALDLAAGHGDVNEVKRLLAAGANVNTPNIMGSTPLHMSAAQGHVEGWTPLHASAFMRRVEVSQMLIEAGANVHATDNEGKTLLEAAEQRSVFTQQEEHRAIVALLQQAAESEPLTKSAAQGRAGGADQ